MNKVKLAFLAVSISLATIFTFSCTTESDCDGADCIDTEGKSVDDLLADGVKSLEAEKWEEAVAYYDAAYENDNNDAKAIIYSVLANLAKISVDDKVVSLIKENFGFTKYPNRLNALFSKDWLEKVPNSDYIEYEYCNGNTCGYWYDEYELEWYDLDKVGYYSCGYNSGNYNCTLLSSTPQYDSVYLPAIKIPDWVKGGKGSVYNDALFSGNVFNSEAWAISLLANILDKNSSGLNNLLDGVIDGVFGTSYNEAVNRLKKLENRKEERISLDPYFIEKLDLEDVFDKYDKIGWAEVNAVLSAMLAVKASLEWVASYDLNMDLSWLKYAWKDDPADMVNHFKNADASRLPFNNNFLKARPGKMDIAKADYIKAIEGLRASYASIQSSELYPDEAKDAYATVNDGFGKLIEAIRDGGKFYIPEDPTKGTWPTSKGEDVIGSIELGRFFTPGYFSLQEIFETESNGKPVFYLNEQKLTKGNYSALIDQGGYLQLAFKTSYINAASDMGNELPEFVEIGLHRDVAKAVFEKYYP